MSNYIGQAPVFGDFPFEILTGDGTNFYELSFKTNGTNGLLVFLNGAVQRPGIDFTCDGNALTFSANVSVGVQIFVYGMGLPKSSLAPSAGSVGLAELSNEVRASGGDAQDWSNLLKLLTPKGLNDSLKGSNQILLPNGYQKIPGGLIIQWGLAATGGAGTGLLDLTFPISFPNSLLGLSVTAGASDGSVNASWDANSATGFRVATRNIVTGMVDTSLYYIAIGH